MRSLSPQTAASPSLTVADQSRRPTCAAPASLSLTTPLIHRPQRHHHGVFNPSPCSSRSFLAPPPSKLHRTLSRARPNPPHRLIDFFARRHHRIPISRRPTTVNRDQAQPPATPLLPVTPPASLPTTSSQLSQYRGYENNVDDAKEEDDTEEEDELPGESGNRMNHLTVDFAQTQGNQNASIPSSSAPPHLQCCASSQPPETRVSLLSPIVVADAAEPSHVKTAQTCEAHCCNNPAYPHQAVHPVAATATKTAQQPSPSTPARRCSLHQSKPPASPSSAQSEKKTISKMKEGDRKENCETEEEA
ncbi:hypothetical protein M0R45_009322 [Rubus argutus]|uniref:Uncharacterized protein n=1 Tax=Rubus argutus TaxID=59490 RepID=A0AAW1Y5Q4_RUBAR